MKLSEILTPEEVERRIRRTFELRELIKAIQRENAEILSEMKKYGQTFLKSRVSDAE